jgi:hypothetical protein
LSARFSIFCPCPTADRAYCIVSLSGSELQLALLSAPTPPLSLSADVDPASERLDSQKGKKKKAELPDTNIKNLTFQPIFQAH